MLWRIQRARWHIAYHGALALAAFLRLIGWAAIALLVAASAAFTRVTEFGAERGEVLGAPAPDDLSPLAEVHEITTAAWPATREDA